MIWSRISSTAAVCSLFLGALGQQTTVYIWPSSCSLQPSTLVNNSPTSTPSPTSSATPTPSLDSPFLVFIDFANGLTKRAETLYIGDSGSLTSDPHAAAQFELKSARLRTKVGYLSTSGQVRSQIFAASPITLPVATMFSIGQDDSLRWTSDLFFAGQARFCLLNSIVNVDFSGEPALGCVLIKLGTIDASSVLGQNSGSRSRTVTTVLSTTIITEPGTYSPTFSLTTFGTSSRTVSTSSPFNPTFISTPTVNPTSSSTLIGTGISGSFVSVSSTGYPAPTSTGAPTCENDSKFDGTVNGNYLILCDTPLPGSNLAELPAANFASCIAQCSSYPAEGGDRCVAVEYVASLPGSECRLKSEIPAIRRDSNDMVEAAIVVNVPYAPPIIFIDPSTSLSTVRTSTSGDFPTMQPSSSVPTRSTTALTTVLPTMRPSSTTRSQLGSSFSSTLPSTPSTPIIRTSPQVSPQSSSSTTRGNEQSMSPPSRSSSVAVSSSPSSGSSFATFTTPFTTSTGSVFVSPSLATANPTAPPATTTPSSQSSALCPNGDNQVLNVNNDGYNYEILCNNDIQGQPLTANATWANSFQDCISQCTLYNVAIPFRCIGVKYLGMEGLNGMNNCFLMSSYAGKACLNSVYAARLMYGGYQNPTGGACGPRSTSTSTTSSSRLAEPTVVTGSGTSSRPNSSSSTLSSTNLFVPTTTTTGIGPSNAPSSTRTESRSSGLSTTVSVTTGVPSNPTSFLSSNTVIQTTSAGTSVVPPPGSSTSSPRASSSASTSTTSTTTTTTTGAPTTTTTALLVTSSSSTTTTPRTTTSTFSTIPPYTGTPCPSPQNGTLDPEIGPVSLECQAGQPQDAVCYGYAFDFNNDPSNPKPGFRYDGWVNYEIECKTKFGGREMAPAYSPGRANDLFDCIKSCDEATREYPNDPSPRCVGVTFIDNATLPQNGNFGDNNCFKYNQINCATRGMNSSYQSARLLYDRYPVMNDYDPSFNC